MLCVNLLPAPPLRNKGWTRNPGQRTMKHEDLDRYGGNPENHVGHPIIEEL